MVAQDVFHSPIHDMRRKSFVFLLEPEKRVSVEIDFKTTATTEDKNE